jgi:hypothetical protein
MKISTRATAVAILLAPLALAPSKALAADAVPHFGFIAPGWLAPQSIDMTPFWSAAGLPETGTNYYAAGAPASSSSPLWERFDPTSPLYQAWFGAYVVDDFQFASEWSHPHVRVADIPNSIQRVIALASVDQIAWLTGYEDPHPEAAVDPSSVVVVPAADGYFLVLARMATDSDVGAEVAPFPWTQPESAVASEVSPYAKVTLTTAAAFKYLPSRGELVIVYWSGTEWTTLDGARHATPAFVTLEQFTMMARTTFPE